MKRTLLTTLALVVLLTGGCGKEKTDMAPPSPTPTPTPYPTPPSPPGGGSGTPSDNWNYGSTVSLTIVDWVTFHDLVGYSASPTQLRLNVNMVDIGSAKYAGHLKFGMVNSGQYLEAYYTSGTNQNDAKYNIWFNWQGKSVFHGFFQDEYTCAHSTSFCPYFPPKYGGGIVLVIDNMIDLGDGGESLASGSVWFQKFEFTVAPLSPSKCWNVTLGPYDCRTFIVGENVVSNSSLYPNNAGPGGSTPRSLYRKFATFSDLNLTKAFNGTQPR